MVTVPRRLAAFDDLDRRLIGCLYEAPHQGLQEAARRLGIARGTVQARLEHLMSTGVISKLGPHVSARALGYAVESYTVLEVEQMSRIELFARLAAVPNVLEAHIVTGPGDILCRIAARDNNDLRVVIDAILDIPGIRRASTRISLTEAIPYRIGPLLAEAAQAAAH